MLIELKLVKKDSQVIIGSAPEFEDCAMRLDYFVSMGRYDRNPEWCEVFFKGFNAPLLVADTYENIIEKVNSLAQKWGAMRGYVQYDS